VETAVRRLLEQQSRQTGEPFVPFDIDTDYRRHVDEKPRLDGVTAFLESRGIQLPYGTQEDGTDVNTVHALGKKMDRFFLEHLQQYGVERYEPAIALVRTLRAHDIKTAVVTSSNNSATVLEAAGIADLFGARVDGLDVTRLALNGKPAPDAFLEAARRLNAEPSRAVVVEDAVAGVEAGRAGRFGSASRRTRQIADPSLEHPPGRSLRSRKSVVSIIAMSGAQRKRPIRPSLAAGA
jgi:HAD superfamily hydrolase (TIGR01509 family)